MAKVMPGRYTAKVEGSYVVFIIGMRINRLLAVHKWVPVVRTMGKMMGELYSIPNLVFWAAAPVSASSPDAPRFRYLALV